MATTESGAALRRSLEELLAERSGEIARALTEKAAGGDLKAFGLIREILGEGGAERRSLPEDLRALTLEELRAMREYLEGLAAPGAADEG